jgi:hypothetical protein
LAELKFDAWSFVHLMADMAHFSGKLPGRRPVAGNRFTLSDAGVRGPSDRALQALWTPVKDRRRSSLSWAPAQRAPSHLVRGKEMKTFDDLRSEVAALTVGGGASWI